MEKVEDVLQPTRLKSILKAKTTSSVTNLEKNPQTGQNFIEMDVKKKVEIAAPPPSPQTAPSAAATSVQKRILKKSKKQRPLPRVALLPPKENKPSLASDSTKIMITTASNPKTNKPSPLLNRRSRSMTANKAVTPSPSHNAKYPKTSVSTSEIKEKSKEDKPRVSSSKSRATVAPHIIPKKKKSVRKLKKKSKSAVVVVGAEEEGKDQEVPQAGGKEYVKELFTINELLKSVTRPVTMGMDGRPIATPLIGGVVRRFSAVELHQLLTSVEKVATIHEALEPDDFATINPEDLGGLMKKAKSEPDTSAKDNIKKKKTVRRSKSKLKTSKPSVSAVTTTTSPTPPAGKGKVVNHTKKDDGKLLPARGSSNKNLASNKVLKQNVKKVKTTLKKQKVRPTSSEKSVEDLHKDKDLEPKVEKELSELDLVKSAMLNQQYYEESMALKQEEEEEGNIKMKKGKKSRQVRKSKEEDKTATYTEQAYETAEPHENPDDTLHIIDTEVLDLEDFPVGEPASLPIPLETEENKSITHDPRFNRTLANVSIHNQVLRNSASSPPKGVPHFSTQPQLEHSGVTKSMALLETVEHKAAKTTGMLDKKIIINKTEGKSRFLPIKDLGEPKSQPANQSQEVKTEIGKPAGEAVVTEKKWIQKKFGFLRPKEKATQRASLPVIPMRRRQAKDKDSTATDNTDDEIEILKSRDSAWNNQSIAPSLFKAFPDTGISRWSILNDRVVERNRQLAKAEVKGAHPHPHSRGHNAREKARALDDLEKVHFSGKNNTKAGVGHQRRPNTTFTTRATR